MKIIHDGEMGGVGTLALIVNWGIKTTCQVKGCENNSNAIMCLSESESPTDKAEHIGICEDHYQKTKIGDNHYRFNEIITFEEGGK